MNDRICKNQSLFNSEAFCAPLFSFFFFTWPVVKGGIHRR